MPNELHVLGCAVLIVTGLLGVLILSEAGAAARSIGPQFDVQKRIASESPASNLKETRP